MNFGPRTPANIAALPPQRKDILDLGRAPANLPVRIAVVLRYQQESQLAWLLAAQSTPGSRYFHRYLSNMDFNAYFAPTQAAYTQAIRALSQAGFRITTTFPNRTVVDAQAPASVAERFFSTEIHSVYQYGHGRRYANSRPALMPASLAGVVSVIAGLNNLIVAKPLVSLTRTNRVLSTSPWGPHFKLVVSAPIGGPLQGPDFGFGPLAFAQGYNMPVQHGFNGQGRSTGIVISGDFAEGQTQVAPCAKTGVLNNDLAFFLAFFADTRTGPATTRVKVDGGNCYAPMTQDTIEATLDAEAIVSLAPGTHLYMYLIPNLSDVSVIDGYTQAVNDGVADVVNSSFGGCEQGNAPFTTATNNLAAQGGVKGMTFAASTGDTGYDAGCAGVPAVSAPASDPNFVGVGGTNLMVTGTGNWVSETCWGSGPATGGGGGVSVVWAMPAYQNGVTGIRAGGRNLPDISFDGDPATGMSLYIKDPNFFNGSGGWSGIAGGTSLSSPIFSAVQTEINQARGTRFGFVNPNIYSAYKLHFSTFHDIITGNNGFPAGPNFDLCSGMGSADTSLLSSEE